MIWDYADVEYPSLRHRQLVRGLFWGRLDREQQRRLCSLPAPAVGHSSQAQCQADPRGRQSLSIESESSTDDPPYYDNIGYADLSDYFYVWLASYNATIVPGFLRYGRAVPKAEELVATPYRHGGKDACRRPSFWAEYDTARTAQACGDASHPGFPVTIYYAFKQTEWKGDTGIASTGWETFLGRCDSLRLRDYGHLADANRERQPA